MYICVCNAIRETDFRQAARCNGGDAERIYADMGKPPQCRQCLPDAAQILFEERSLVTSVAA